LMEPHFTRTLWARKELEWSFNSQIFESFLVLIDIGDRYCRRFISRLYNISHDLICCT
jgi:hypothetical protein